MTDALYDKFQKYLKLKSASEGTILFDESQPDTEIFFLVEGEAKLIKDSEDGRELIISVCHAKDILGDIQIYEQNCRHGATAVMKTDGVIGKIKKEDLEGLIYEDPEIQVILMKWMSLTKRRAQTKNRDMILYGKQGALYSTLIRLCNSFGKANDDGSLAITCEMTQQDLASIIGSTRETVTRMMNELQKEKVLTIKRGHITIHHLDYLKEYMECPDCPNQVCRI